MNIDYEKARNLMVENQLRPNKINEPTILKLFSSIKKEDFLSNELKDTSYNDLDINLINKRGYLKNLHIAQLIQYAEIESHHKVLHIGGLTGYVTTILSHFCKKVIVMENSDILSTSLKNNLTKLNINNVKIIKNSLFDGCDEESPFDIIFIDNPLKKYSEKLKMQVNSNSGKIIIIKKIDFHLSKAYKITRNNNYFSEEYLFDIFTECELFDHNEGFNF